MLLLRGYLQKREDVRDSSQSSATFTAPMRWKASQCDPHDAASTTTSTASDAETQEGFGSGATRVSTSSPHLKQDTPSASNFRATDTSAKPPSMQLLVFDKEIPAHLRQRFLDLKVLYSEPLWRAVSKKRPNPGDISMTLKYLGEKETLVALYIVVQCEKGLCKKIRKFFAQPHVREDLRSDFQVHVIGVPPLRLSGQEGLQVFTDSADHDSLCGLRLKIQGVNGTAVEATLGGLIVARTGDDLTIYGMTASHHLGALGATAPVSPPSTPPGSSDADGSGTDSDDPYTHEFVGIPQAEAQNCPSTASSTKTWGTKPIGAVFCHSLSLPQNRDWALVSISPENWRPNLVSNRHVSALGTLSHLSSAGVRAWVSTPRGPQSGLLRREESCLLVSPGRSFADTLRFVPDKSSRILPGDSGCWVVGQETLGNSHNPDSCRLYGHLVSCDIFGDALVMPLQDTFRDIKASLEASQIKLPSANDFEVARQQAQERSSQKFYGYLFEAAEPFPRPTPILVDLLRAIALHIRREFNDNSFSETFLTPGMLSSFYKAAGHDYDGLFVYMPHQSISFIYRVQSCQHALISADDSAPPSIPALTTNGFVRWQAIQILLDPQNHVPVMQYAAKNWNLKHPDDETLFPTLLPSSAFPAETDPDTDVWHQRCADTLREQARDQKPAGDLDTPGRGTGRLPTRPTPKAASRRTPVKTSFSSSRRGSTSSSQVKSPFPDSSAYPARERTSRPGSRRSSTHSQHDLRSRRSREHFDGPRQHSRRGSQESLRGTAQRDRRRRAREEDLDSDSEIEIRGVSGRRYPEAVVSPPYEAVWRPKRETDRTVDTAVDSSDELEEDESKGKEGRVGRKKRSLST
ncbi:hypothetical protein QBC34DRAFT_66926 [Podospora aff. communis PSN243]|uniref:DUF7514 domain-containing protein n=1 Tax=Podospora aff. communis PSN243 TaxID=3040156 RepID=A0AAV9H384_9PEZI|nr:hypothetical protein QBC34DRAFT_66926 [Podospora aff. communis PSN243]